MCSAAAGSVPFFRALVDIQSNAGNNQFRQSLIRSHTFQSLMDTLQAIHSKGRTLVHPKIVKLLEVME
jgi:hypothetical protein